MPSRRWPTSGPTTALELAASLAASLASRRQSGCARWPRPQGSLHDHLRRAPHPFGQGSAPEWAGGPRALGVTPVDSLWLRLIDVGAALTARGYSSGCDVVLDVVDPVCPWNQRPWRLTVGVDGVATCLPTSDDADVRLPVQSLGAAYLGSRSLATQTHQGLITELTPGSVRLLSRAMSRDREPVGAIEF